VNGGLRAALTLSTVTAAGVSVWLDALAGSHDRLCDLVSELDDAALREQSYCDGWTIAQVLSHIGSGAEIMGTVVDVAIGDVPPTPPEALPDIWARWDALAPESVRDEALAADGGFVERLEQLGDAIDEVEYTLFGRVRTDAAGLLRARLSEHALHTWDIEVARDPRARVDPDAVALLVDGLPQALAWLGKPEHAGWSRRYAVRVVTSAPDRVFRLDVSEVASLTTAGEGTSSQHTLQLPAEAFLRLVYGRLDPSHAPAVGPDERATLDELRKVFPGP
jgi:uncharacterized protein (TIGR03083 family)